MHVNSALGHGDKFPYDGGREFWNDEAPPPPPTDWAHRAARGVLADLCDRRGVRQELDDVDHDMRAEIVAALATIIRASAADLLEALGEAEIMSNEAGRAGVDWRRRFAGVIARARGEG